MLVKGCTLYKGCMESMQSNGCISEKQEETTNSINECLLRAIKSANTQCRKGRKGSIPFSPEAKTIMGTMRVPKCLYWRTRLKGKKGRPRRRKIENIARKCDYQGDLALDDEKEIKELMQKTAKQYSEFRPKAHEFRQTHIRRITDELAERDGQKAEMHFRNLLKREEIKTKFKRIKSAKKRTQGSGITRVEKELNGNRITITEKTEIENKIARVNMARLLQANNTPLHQEPLSEILGEQINLKNGKKSLKEKSIFL